MNEPSWKTIIVGFLFGMGFAVGMGVVRAVLDFLASHT